ncbi:MAG: amidohydrolase [Ectothiorhodospiraceae bacterium]|nr:amidohydrolase [Ectothiorhodospiraceae bacterium]
MDDFVAERLPAWVALRRDIHREAELGFTEYRTVAVLADRLGQLGFALRMGSEVMAGESMRGRPAPELVTRRAASAAEIPGGAAVARALPDGMTGLVAELRRGDGPVVALRFDIDALPVNESADRAHRPAAGGYRSANAGVMHACGHDGHAAIGIGVAEWLADPRSRWSGTIRLVFQPAEEGGRGAKPMADAGVVDDCTHFFAAHLGCGLASGRIAAAATSMLYSTKLDVRFRGRAAHAGGSPHEGRNALLAGATATVGLHAISRHGEGRSRVNVGRMDAGTARNVIADHCLLEMEVRGETEAVADYMEQRAREVIAGAAAMHDVTHEIEVVGQTIGGDADATAADIVASAAAATPGVREVLPVWALGGGEDAPFFMRRVQARGGIATYFVIGADLAACHHAVDFDFDEASIGTGVAVYARVVEQASAAA